MPGIDTKPENTIRIRQKDPSQYVRFRTKSLGKGIKAVIGFKKGGGSEVQSYLFDKDKWNAKTAAAWVKKHKGTISGAVDILRKYGLAVFGSFSEAEVTEEIAQKYGMSLKDINQEGFKLIEGVLMFLDKPCRPVITGAPLSDIEISEVMFDSERASDYLSSLKNKPIHINSTLSGHWNKDGISRKVIGSCLGARIDTEDNEKVVKFLGGIYDQSHPVDAKRIHKEKENLGASVEMTPGELEIDGDSLIANIKSWVFKGAAILEKKFAAFPDTSLLIAQTSEYTDKTERRKSMDPIYTQEDFDKQLKSSIEAAKENWNKELQDSEAMKTKEKEISDLKAQVEDEEKKVEEANKKVEALEKEKEEAEKKAEDEKKDAEITASATKWYDDNKDSFDEKDKEKVVEIRKAMIAGSATVEQIDSMEGLRKRETKKSDLYGGKDGRLTDNELDAKHGIRLRPK